MPVGFRGDAVQMTLVELRERIDQLHQLLAQPEHGLVACKAEIGRLMNELVYRWK